QFRRIDSFQSGGNDALEGLQMEVEGNTADIAQPVPGHRLAVDEVPPERHVAGLLELAQLRAQVAVRQRQLLLEAREADLFVAGQQDTDGEPRAVLEERIEAVQRLHSCAAAVRLRRLLWPAHASARPITMPVAVQV